MLRKRGITMRNTMPASEIRSCFCALAWLILVIMTRPVLKSIMILLIMSMLALL